MPERENGAHHAQALAARGPLNLTALQAEGGCSPFFTLLGHQRSYLLYVECQHVPKESKHFTQSQMAFCQQDSRILQFEMICLHTASFHERFAVT